MFSNRDFTLTAPIRDCPTCGMPLNIHGEPNDDGSFDIEYWCGRCDAKPEQKEQTTDGR